MRRTRLTERHHNRRLLREIAVCVFAYLATMWKPHTAVNVPEDYLTTQNFLHGTLMLANVVATLPHAVSDESVVLGIHFAQI